MASLTETTNQARGKTVLYIPAEDLADFAAAASDKDLVQRLESTPLQLTRIARALARPLWRRCCCCCRRRRRRCCAVALQT